MGRKILFVTTDQQRYDALGCNGGDVARTPWVDSMAAAGINYRRAHNQNVVCMPARSTMLTGQYVRSHGVFANGVPLPYDSPSIARYLNEVANYRTALLGKAHFDPAFDVAGRWRENTMARDGSTGPLRGFEHLELAMHGPMSAWHYGKWLRERHPEERKGFYPLFADGALNSSGGGDTGAPQVSLNPIERGHYHTDWVADRTISYLDTLSDTDDWFVWMSFPDPHHPWDPPQSEMSRVDWRETALPPAHPGSPARCAELLAGRPRHWLGYFDGSFSNREGGPVGFVPARMEDDQLREVIARIHVENELIDEACARVMRRIEERGWAADTDVFFTTDHGELQGDFGLLFKGPYHCEALMHIPLVWRPAPSARIAPAEIDDPVGQVDLAATFGEIAGVEVPSWVQGSPLPLQGDSGREWMVTEWDSQFDDIDMHLRSIYADGRVCTVYESGGMYEGTEGELYDLRDDPLQWHNLWDDPSHAGTRSELTALLREVLVPAREPRLSVEAPT